MNLEDVLNMDDKEFKKAFKTSLSNVDALDSLDEDNISLEDAIKSLEALAAG